MSICPPAQVPDSGISWPWLTSAAEMAAETCTRLLPPGSRDAWVRACFPRIATRTPGRDLASVAGARDFARSTLQRWGITERRDDITLVVSELLTNALCHARPGPGGWPVRVGLLQDRPGSAVLCAVADPSQAPPVPAPPGHLAESGRGLHVVEELSDQWGYVTPGYLGKVVWATFAAAANLVAADLAAQPASRRAAGQRSGLSQAEHRGEIVSHDSEQLALRDRR